MVADKRPQFNGLYPGCGEWPMEETSTPQGYLKLTIEMDRLFTDCAVCIGKLGYSLDQNLGTQVLHFAPPCVKDLVLREASIGSRAVTRWAAPYHSSPSLSWGNVGRDLPSVTCPSPSRPEIKGMAMVAGALVNCGGKDSRSKKHVVYDSIIIEIENNIVGFSTGEEICEIGILDR
ncbi:hypothetical protein LguiB_019938 [Lonicera macranthoides]